MLYHSKTTPGFRALLVVAAVITNTVAIPVDPSMERGMAMMSKAHDAVCYYVYLRDLPMNDKKYTSCVHNVEQPISNIRMNEEGYRKYKNMNPEDDFAGWVRQSAVPNLPAAYRSACDSYLMDSESKPPSDESDVLNDGGDDYPYRGYTYCLIKTTRDNYGQKSTDEMVSSLKRYLTCTRKHFIVSGRKTWMDDSLQQGMNMVAKAHDAVCWYSNIKRFPNMDGDGNSGCWDRVEKEANFIKINPTSFQTYPAMVEPTFSSSVDKIPLSSLQPKYRSSCEAYLFDPEANPASDESDVLGDGGANYPYRAYSYCIIKTLRDTYGQKAIDDVKNERTRGTKDWRQTMLDHENLGRIRHGAEPLTILEDLNNDAMAWARKNADDCKMYHSNESTIPDNKYKGEQAGENLHEIGGIAVGGSWDSKQLQGYNAVNSWYNELKTYRFPEDIQNGTYNHFTQSVWKNTKHVGYGRAVNNACKEKQIYIAARYFPPGNEEGKFAQNVMPPQY